MLRNTFQHLPGIGEKTESRLWASGLHTWEELLESTNGHLPRAARAPESLQRIEQSLESYAGRQWRFFEACLPGAAKWRAYGPLRDDVMYVDIETNGYDNDITVIGIYDGTNFHAFVAGENLDDAREMLEQAAVVVTYNGTGFDMPIIRARFPYHLFNHIHIDLMWPLRKLGFRGGLKRIEQEMGLTRSAATRGMSGWDAVYLWREHLRGSQEALDRLLKYNEEDVRNLAPLMDWVYATLRNKTGPSLRI